MEFGDRLRAAREEARITQEELSKLAGVSPGTIANYEAGIRKKPKNEILDSLAKALNVDKNYLLVGVKEKEAIVDTFIESLVKQGFITGIELDDTSRDMILKVVEAKLIKLNNENK